MNYKCWYFVLCCLSGVSELIWHKKELKWEPAFEDRNTVLAVKRRPGLRQDIEVYPVFMPRHAVWEQLGFWLLLGTTSSFPSLARDSQHKLTLEDFFQSVKMILLSPCLWLLGMLGNQLWGISWNQGWCWKKQGLLWILLGTSLQGGGCPHRAPSVPSVPHPLTLLAQVAVPWVGWPVLHLIHVWSGSVLICFQGNWEHGDLNFPATFPSWCSQGREFLVQSNSHLGL